MIVRETAEHFICYKQPDHAQLSGSIAKAWKRELIPSGELFAQTCYAIENHDNGWHIPDELPIWNEKLKQPTSFVHYPLPLKLHFYKVGIDSLDNDYAKLLCSKHYTSFFANATGEEEKEFFLNETMRQTEILDNALYNEKLVEYHFYMLQICDDISLFICLHQPGTKPENYSDWFKNGFRHSETLLGENKKIEIRWKNDDHLQLINSPLQQQVSVLLPYKRLSKEECYTRGLAEAWKKTPTAHSTFTIE
jgi:hypothetical protein